MQCGRRQDSEDKQRPSQFQTFEEDVPVEMQSHMNKDTPINLHGKQI